MLLAKQRRRARLILQQAICFEAWFGLLFYPISCLLLRDKLAALEYNSSLQRALPVCCLVVLIPTDVARYYLGTRGNLRVQVFPLTAFMFLSACPLFPGLVYLTFFAEHRLPFDVVAGISLVLLLIAECAAGFVVLRELLRQEAARFLKMREFSDISTSDEHEECARFLPGEDRKAMARSQ
ncbi:transmembrane protein 17 [Phytophthora cinnamomi]|uniref:transmembrane protein 17 n=1 Tax=Phytophthora cinnamomi TaxID=4785 RepID=UPI00355AC264|nr:transmembrane protein 17 [Phytophthora cinnamomi]